MVKKKTQVKVIVFSGHGLNCEEEVAYGFTLAGANADIVHLNDVIDGRVKLRSYDIIAFPGGFSYGDDTGSGKAYANRVRDHLAGELDTFLGEGKLMIGICNGFPILTRIGLLPGALTFNDSNRYTVRWVDLKVEGESPWLSGITTLSAPIAHGEGKFVASAEEPAKLQEKKQIAFRYVRGPMSSYQDLSANPNGSFGNVAGMLSHEGRVLGLMPHPDRALFATQRPDWPLQKEEARRRGADFPEYGAGLQIFRNGVEYFNK